MTTSSSKVNEIDLFILDSNNKTVFAKKASTEGFFEFNTTIEGSLRLIFSNMRVK